ncbi:hypothetical protein WMY93_031850, partial [Mugilogobius chulae]
MLRPVRTLVWCSEAFCFFKSNRRLSHDNPSGLTSRVVVLWLSRSFLLEGAFSGLVERYRALFGEFVEIRSDKQET